MNKLDTISNNAGIVLYLDAELNHMQRWGEMNPDFSLVDNPQKADNQPMTNRIHLPPISYLVERTFEIFGPNEAIKG